MKIQAKIKILKLEGFDKIITEENKVVVISVKWKSAGKSSKILNPFGYGYSSSSIGKYSGRRSVTNEDCVEWISSHDDGENGGDVFENVVEFIPFGKSSVSFYVLGGGSDEKNTKLAILGRVSVKVTELASMMEIWAEKKIPITLKVAGVVVKTTLSVYVSFVEIRSFQDLPENVHRKVFLKRINSYIPTLDRMKHKFISMKKSKVDTVASSTSTDEFPTTESILRSSSTSDTRLYPARKIAFWKRRLSFNTSPSSSDAPVGFWKKSRMSFRSMTLTTQVEPLIEKSSSDDSGAIEGDGDKKLNISAIDSIAPVSIQNEDETGTSSAAPDAKLETETDTTGSWEVKEILSRDGLMKLQVSVFFASFDQCNQEVGGESACTVLSTVIAHWLHCNQTTTPTRVEFDGLINLGSLEWRKLCSNSSCSADKYFDLKTILEAKLIPLSVSDEKSFVGLFNPEKFESLSGITSFDDIWNEINTNIQENGSEIYIVSWYDHFFVLKIDSDAYYIIDTLGTRLQEGCNKAYILKFDESTTMYEKKVEPEEKEEEIRKGKDCCGDFIKSFLAAVPVKELEEESKKGTVSKISLLQRLQIEFHYTCTQK